MKISATFNWNTPKNKQLVSAMLALETVDETKRFLRDLMTEGEIEEFAKRLEAARLLTLTTPYSSITKNTGLSSTTVARISKWLNGSLGGYRLVLSRIIPNTNLQHHHNPSPVGKGLSS